MKWILMLCFAGMILACNNKAGKDQERKDSTATADAPVSYDRSLVGTWKPVRVELPGESEAQKQKILNETRLVFAGDGQVTLYTGEETRNGTYLFSEQDSKLSITQNEKTERFDISWEAALLKMTNEKGTVVLQRQ